MSVNGLAIGPAKSSPWRAAAACRFGFHIRRQVRHRFFITRADLTTCENILVRQLESLPGGLGINADDWMAGLYAALVLLLAECFNLY